MPFGAAALVLVPSLVSRKDDFCAAKDIYRRCKKILESCFSKITHFFDFCVIVQHGFLAFPERQNKRPFIIFSQERQDVLFTKPIFPFVVDQVMQKQEIKFVFISC